MQPLNLGPKLTKLTAATSSSSGALLGGGSTIVVKNEGTVTAFIATGKDSATAVLDESMPVLAGTVETFTIPSQHNYVAAITRSGSGTVYVVRSEGF